MADELPVDPFETNTYSVTFTLIDVEQVTIDVTARPRCSTTQPATT